MRTLPDYIDAARAATNTQSDRRLSLLLGHADSAVSHYRSLRAFPDDETMIKLATLAGLDPLSALIDLNIWRSDDKGLARSTYIELARKLGRSAAMIALVAALGAVAAATMPGRSALASLPAHSAGTAAEQLNALGAPNVYYGKRRRWFTRQFLPSFIWMRHFGILLNPHDLCRLVMRFFARWHARRSARTTYTIQAAFRLRIPILLRWAKIPFKTKTGDFSHER